MNPISSNAPTLATEIASRRRSLDGMAYASWLPNPDPILKRMGKDITAYRDLRSHSHVGGCIRRRKSVVLSMERRIDKNGSSARMTKLCQTLIDNINLNQLISEILDSVLYGYSPLEVMWKEGSYPLIPESIIAKPPEWFHFDQDANIRFKSQENAMHGDPFMPYKFIVATQDASYANPYGFADLSMCFWPTLFLRNGLKYWVTFTEKFGMPWVIGKQPRGTDLATQNQLLDQLEAMVQDAIAVVPDDASVDTLKTDRQASADIYDRLLMYCRSEIAVALLGQNQTTEASATLASSTAGQTVISDIRDSDARIVESAFNQLFKWMTELNESKTAASPKFELYEEEEVSLEIAQRDKTLTEAGVKFTNAYWMRRYNLEDADIDTSEPALAATQTLVPQSIPSVKPTVTAAQPAQNTEPSANFAEAQSSTEILNQQLNTASDKVLENWMQKIKSTVDLAESKEDLANKLVNLYGQLPLNQLTEIMTLAFAAADLSGRFSVQNEATK